MPPPTANAITERIIFIISVSLRGCPLRNRWACRKWRAEGRDIRARYALLHHRRGRDKLCKIYRGGVEDRRKTQMHAVDLAVYVRKYGARDHPSLSEKGGLERDRVHTCGNPRHLDRHVLPVLHRKVERTEGNRLDG